MIEANKIILVDLEGVLIPEMWPHISKKTCIQDLSITTREVPDYVSLTLKRIHILNEYNITIYKLKELVSDLEPLPGAVTFINKVKQSSSVVIVSDAFLQMVEPITTHFNDIEVKCNKYQVDHSGRIVMPCFRRTRGKSEELESIPVDTKVMFIGDAFNDLDLLRNSDFGVLFNPSPEVAESAKDILIVKDYNEIPLKKFLEA